MIAPMPYFRKLDVARPIRIQKITCRPRPPKRRVIAAPKISTAVSARPIIPENSGV